MTTRRSSNQSNGPLPLHRSTLPLHRSTPTSRCIRSGETGNHLWVERFDKPLAGLFDMQDEIVVATPLSAPSAPPVALLTALFDLTPTEGRIAGGDSRREGGEPARDRTRTVRRDSSQLFEIGIPQDRRPSSGRTRFVACWRTPFEALRSPLLGRPSVASEKGRTAGPQAVDDGRLDVDEATGCLGAARATGARPWATSSGWRHRRRA